MFPHAKINQSPPPQKNTNTNIQECPFEIIHVMLLRIKLHNIISTAVNGSSKL